MHPLYIRNAESSVDRFVEFDSDDKLILESAQAVDCLDCEAFLSAGIHSFREIQEADSVLRSAILRGKIELERLDDLILGLLHKWTEPVEKAFQWARRCQDNGFELDNLAEFGACVAEVFAIIGFDPTAEMRKPLERLRDKAVMEHRNDETVDCLSDEE